MSATDSSPGAGMRPGGSPVSTVEFASQAILAINAPTAPARKILVYSINFPPELVGVGKYVGELTSWLVKAGHEVRVVTAPPYYPQWATLPGYRSRWYSSEQWAGARVFRAPLYVPTRPTGIRRLLHLASFALTSLPSLFRNLFWRADLVLVVEPPVLCAPAAWAFSRLSGAKAWLHVQDFEVNAGYSLGLLRNRLARLVVLTLEKWLMARFDRVSSICEAMLSLARDKLAWRQAPFLFPNWVDIDEIRPLAGPSRFRESLGIPADSIVILYSGSMGVKHGLDLILEAAAALESERDIVFVICGNGATQAPLQAAGVHLSNLCFLDLQPPEALNELLGLADIHLLPQRASAADLVLPSKLGGMLASGRPVVTTAATGTELARVVQDRGVVVPPEDSAALARAVLALARDPEKRATFGAAGRAYACENLERDKILRRFEREVVRVTTGTHEHGSC